MTLGKNTPTGSDTTTGATATACTIVAVTTSPSSSARATRAVVTAALIAATAAAPVKDFFREDWMTSATTEEVDVIANAPEFHELQRLAKRATNYINFFRGGEKVWGGGGEVEGRGGVGRGGDPGWREGPKH